MTVRRPPRLALWLLEQRVPQHEREYLVGDLLEEFHRADASPAGQRAARRRFWREAIAASLRRERDHQSIPFSRGLMTDFGLDLSLALRRLVRTPGFTLTTSLTLALGVGAACAIAAVAGPALWGALPFRDADRIVTVRERFGDGSLGRMGFTTISDLRRETSSFQALAASANWSPTLTGDGEAERLTGLSVSASWLDVMGVRSALGRGFLPEDDRPESARVVMLDHHLWQRRFGGDSAIVGRTIRLGDVEHEVVGVLPASHEHVLAPGAELLRPLRYLDTLGQACRSCRHVFAVARIKSDVAPATAARDVAAAFERMRAAYPSDYGFNGVAVASLRDYMTEGVRGPLYALLGAAALLLFIAMANATNLFVARTIQRGGEMTIRSALGASRWRLSRSMLIEALLVSLLGALFGLALAHSAIGTLVALAPPSLPRIDQVRIGLTTTLLAGVLALALGMVSGLLPASLLNTKGLRARLAASSRTVARGGHDAMRRGIVVLEMALTLLLLGGAGILVQSVNHLLAVDTGFATSNRLTVALSVGGPRYDDDAQVHLAWRNVHEAVRAIPGVVDASLTSQLPMSSDFDAWGIHWEQTPRQNAAEDGDAFRFAVTPDYMRTMGLHLVQGRFLDPSDHAQSEKVMVVNEQIVRRDFAGRNPIGARAKMGGMDGPWRTVVGVVKNVRHRGLDSEMSGQVYIPLDQNSYADGMVRLVVHTTLDAASMTTAIRQAVRGVDPSIPLAQVMTLPAMIAESTTQRRFAQQLFQSFALTALVLAAIGIFGVLSGMVGERVREIGVRSALGASRGQIVGHFLRQGGVLALAGIAIGIAGSFMLAGALKPLVFGISPRDPLTIAGVSAGLGLVALLATLLPAWRASRVDAAVALRSD